MAERDKNEIVVVELERENRIRIYSQITGRMVELGMNPADFKQLELGFELSPGWLVDVNSQPTLAQLVVMAQKLNMQLVINDLNLYPRKENATDGV